MRPHRPPHVPSHSLVLYVQSIRILYSLTATFTVTPPPLSLPTRGGIELLCWTIVPFPLVFSFGKPPLADRPPSTSGPPGVPPLHPCYSLFFLSSDPFCVFPLTSPLLILVLGLFPWGRASPLGWSLLVISVLQYWRDDCLEYG